VVVMVLSLMGVQMTLQVEELMFPHGADQTFGLHSRFHRKLSTKDTGHPRPWVSDRPCGRRQVSPNLATINNSRQILTLNTTNNTNSSMNRMDTHNEIKKHSPPDFLFPPVLAHFQFLSHHTISPFHSFDTEKQKNRNTSEKP
jgi:hypothetical protein